ncbi:hypothetical protein B0T25DRAFT_126444 [Lasiosphaeria hispida]|uniref:Uncharacterized protein n=1 Tax=Lasiosphaeria hispida TaxID=260671 RepID=A0AAJ0HS79_9PEZI|nr:hypothetical protein B0T25DRAFT_126444 [Lasiosphaeria hispida]
MARHATYGAAAGGRRETASGLASRETPSCMEDPGVSVAPAAARVRVVDVLSHISLHICVRPFCDLVATMRGALEAFQLLPRAGSLPPSLRLPPPHTRGHQCKSAYRSCCFVFSGVFFTYCFLPLWYTERSSSKGDDGEGGYPPSHAQAASASRMRGLLSRSAIATFGH